MSNKTIEKRRFSNIWVAWNKSHAGIKDLISTAKKKRKKKNVSYTPPSTTKHFLSELKEVNAKFASRDLRLSWAQFSLAHLPIKLNVKIFSLCSTSSKLLPSSSAKKEKEHILKPTVLLIKSRLAMFYTISENAIAWISNVLLWSPASERDDQRGTSKIQCTFRFVRAAIVIIKNSFFFSFFLFTEFSRPATKVNYIKITRDGLTQKSYEWNKQTQ